METDRKVQIMNDKINNGITHPRSKKSVFLRSLRIIAVSIVTAALFFLFLVSIIEDEFDFEIVVFALIMIFAGLYFIILPIAGFWIYSFIKSITRKTKTDKVLLWIHIADLLLLATVIIIDNQPSRKCDAFIMEEEYRGENGRLMRNIAEHYRHALPDSTRLCVEINNEELSHSEVLSESEIKKLENELKDCGCIGIDVDNYSDRGYSSVRFRRIGFGMYSYRFYDKPLTRQEQDSLNKNQYLIVYNDSTVFEFGSGVFGAQYFVGKEEFLKELNSKH